MQMQSRLMMMMAFFWEMGRWWRWQMAVKELPSFVWRTFAAGHAALSEKGAVATAITKNYANTLTTTGVELTEGKHYWEVELLSKSGGGLVDIDCYLKFDLLYVLVLGIFIGISRPNLDPTGWYFGRNCTDGWFMHAARGALWGNGKEGDDAAGGFKKADRVGVLLDLGDGSLRFFKNGAQHGPGYAAGSVTGPVVAAVQMSYSHNSVRLLGGKRTASSPSKRFAEPPSSFQHGEQRHSSRLHKVPEDL
jgi:hypothetical protein